MNPEPYLGAAPIPPSTSTPVGDLVTQHEPTRDERIAALAEARLHLKTAEHALAAARKAVVPSSPRNVLDRPKNYDYQRSVADALTELIPAKRIIDFALNALVPPRCDWPGGHLGPWEAVPPFTHVKHCTACGEEIGQ